MTSGTYQVTADGLAGPAKAVRVNSIILKSDGTAGVLTVKNGATGATVYDQLDGTVNQAIIRNYEGGLVLPAGCYIDLDSHCIYVTVNLEAIGD